MLARPGLVLAVVLAGCTHPTAEAPRPSPPVADPDSYARADRTAVTHLQLDLAVDFATKRLTGTAELALQRTVPGAELVLDTDALDIAAVTACGGARALEFKLGAVDKIHGAPLTIQLPPDVTCVAIKYRSSPDAKALLWVEPAGTAGGVQPMVFSQSEAILGRSWVPLQDTPSVRFTYDATVHVPPQLMALMSAENPQQRSADGVYHFRQPHPIPSYLMALAVGDFAFRAIGPRAGVYAEPGVVDAAAREFEEVQAMMTTAEQLYGPYRWGRYDMLVLPPCFPFGGMENPMLTFLTPTLITGDRALVYVVAHELAHSWAGNLVTNATWSDAWLNEGITTYVERRIMEQVRGVEFTDLLWHLGRRDLTEAVARLGATSPKTRLALLPDPGDDDPGSGTIPYEKGSLFMRTVERKVGRPAFDTFLRGRFDRFAFQSVGSRVFVDDMASHLPGTRDLAERWVFQPGVPADAPPDESALAVRIAAAAQAYSASGAAFDAKAWKTLEWVSFIRALPADTTLDRLHALDQQYHLTDSPNAELSMYWLPVLIAHDDRAAVPAIDRYLGKVGRLRMIREVYAALAKQGGFWLDHARAVFAQVEARYHPVSRGAIGAALAKP